MIVAISVRWLQMILALCENFIVACERVIDTGLYKDMLEHLSWPSLTTESLDSKGPRHLVFMHLAVLHNVVRKKLTVARAPFRRNKVVDKVQKFRKFGKHSVIVYLSSHSSCFAFQITRLMRYDMSNI